MGIEHVLGLHMGDAKISAKGGVYMSTRRGAAGPSRVSELEAELEGLEAELEESQAELKRRGSSTTS